MRSSIYTGLAALGFLAMFWLYDIVQQPGTQSLPALGLGVALGVASAVTVRMIVRAGQTLSAEERVMVRTHGEARNARRAE